MDKAYRTLFNQAWSEDLYRRYREKLEGKVGRIPFPLAETPLFLDAPLRQHLTRASLDIVAQLSEPALLAKLKQAIPERYNTPGMDPLPNCVQVDFALCPGPDGQLCGRVVELQAFPSLYALMDQKCLAWREVFRGLPGLDRDWTCYFDMDRTTALARVREMLLGGEDPQHVVLVDITPEEQKTLPDFVATQQMFGVDYECVTRLIKDGRKLYRMKDGKRVLVKRIYNRMVFDELEAKHVVTPFDWRDDLDVTWCSHPNWYWTWSKFVLPHLNHETVPRTRYLDELGVLPKDLHNYVLKPLFSFAGTGVIIDVTQADLDRVPKEQRHGWILQEKVTYAHALPMPDGTGVKAEVRMMLLRGPKDQALVPLLPLIRLSRGKMIGVDHNKNLTWVGGTVGMF